MNSFRLFFLTSFLILTTCKVDSTIPVNNNDNKNTDSLILKSPGQCNDSVNLQNAFTVIFPNGGEVFKSGTQVNLIFCSKDTATYLLDQANISIKKNESNWLTISVEKTNNNFIWQIPDSIYDSFTDAYVSSIGSTWRLRISDYRGSNPLKDTDTSDGYFSIIK